MFGKYSVEICAGGIEDVVTASRFPIDRIELNCALELGGLTPSLSVLSFARKHTAVPIVCMVRPRCAGFVYSQSEQAVMLEDAKRLLGLGADGIVFGFLNPDHSVNEPAVRKMTELIHSYGRTAVFHRAFDETADPFQAMESLISCRIDRVLTSGHAATAPLGAPLLKQLIEAYGSDIEILPGCGINAENIKELLAQTGADQFHMTAKSMREDSGSYAAVDARNIQAVLSVLSASKSSRPSLLTREDAELLHQEQYEKQFF